MKLNDLKDKSILILGLGREGLSVLNFLQKNFPSKKVDVADQKEYTSLPKNVDKTYFGEDYLKSLTNYDVIIKSPGIPYFEEIKKAKDEGKIITSSTSIFLSNCQGRVIGVTGTKGKSTTSSLIYEVLKVGGLDVHLIGNIGTPALDFLEKDSKDTIFVYELSSFQLEDLNLSPHIAVITNIYPEHLDHHGNFGLYFEAKNNITKFQTKDDYLIYNEDVKEFEEVVNLSKAKKIPFSKKDIKIIENLITKDELPLLGDFNILNIMPAVLIARELKIPDEKIVEGIINFIPLPHRLEYVGEFEGIRFYNDSLSTIPQATIAALSAFGSKVQTLIAGGFDRGVDYDVLGQEITNLKIKNLILFPTTGKKIWKEVCRAQKDETLRPKKFDVSTMEEAVRIAYQHTSKGKICLLSPGSSSFNLFKDYEDRGNQFKKYVKDISKKVD